MGYKTAAIQGPARQSSSPFRIVNSNRNPVHMSRELQLREDQRKEAMLKRAMRTETGLRKIAANLANPVREKLDYVGISRKFNVVEQWPDGMPIIYDKDVREWAAVMVGKGGSTRILEIMSERVTLQEFEVTTMPMIPYSELYTRLFQVVNRAKNRLEQSMQLKEDNIYFAALEDCANAYHATVNVSTTLTKDALARSLAPIEFNRLQAANIIMTAYGIMGIRRWQHQDIDEVAREELRKTGYLGGVWGTSLYINDQIATNTFYTVATPELHGWMPIRKDLEVIPNDMPKELLLGFVGYEMYALILHNVLSASKGVFNAGA